MLTNFWSRKAPKGLSDRGESARGNPGLLFWGCAEKSKRLDLFACLVMMLGRFLFDGFEEAVEGVVDDGGFADDVLARHGAKEAAVEGVVAVVAHGPVGVEG
jgi:hypothetical protein